ncbi:hypothetical protein ONZ45_g6879 [Pleurotus djamor]|nr:hypothetical protein ONZ45_g6879 [Pleurotus djamor]
MHDDDDYVETSDVDELELIWNPQKRVSEEEDTASSKRVKLTHDSWFLPATPVREYVASSQEDVDLMNSPDSQPPDFMESQLVIPEELDGDDSDLTASFEPNELGGAPLSPSPKTSQGPSSPIPKLEYDDTLGFPSTPSTPASIGRLSVFPAPPPTSSSPRLSTQDGAGSSQRLHSHSPAPLPSNPPIPRSTTPSSPLTPASPSILPAQHPPPAPQPVHEQVVDVEIPPDIEPTSRYSLRTRQAKQIRPYAYDKTLYKHQMHGNPEAIVKFVSPSRRRSKSRTDGMSDEELAEGEWQPDEDSQERQESPRPLATDILSDLPESDSDPETRALAREGKRLARQRRALEKEKRKREREEEGNHRHRLKRFPVRDAEKLLSSPPIQTLAHRRSRSAPSPSASPERADSASLAADEYPPHANSSAPQVFPDYNAPIIQDLDTVGHTRDSPIDLSDLDEHLASDSDSAVQTSKGRYVEVPSWKLNHVMPFVLADKYARDGQQRNPTGLTHRPRAVGASDQPVQPGQSRVHIAAQPKDADFKGDSESSDEDNSDHMIDSDHDISDSGSDDVVEVDPVEWLNDGFDRSGEAEEADLIDHMITRPRRVARRTESRPRRKRRPRYDIVTAGATPMDLMRQTTLAEASSSTPRRSNTPGSGYRPSRGTKTLDKHFRKPASKHSASDVDHRENREPRKRSYSSKKQQRRKAERDQQGQSFKTQSNGARITSGRANQMVTIDLEEPGFHEAMVTPTWISRKPSERLPLQPLHPPFRDIKLPLPGHQPVEKSDALPVPNKSRKLSFPVDPEFTRPQCLPIGKTFGRHSYIGRGWLHELIHLCPNGGEPSTPQRYSLGQLTIDIHLPLEDFTRNLSLFCEKLVEATVGIPDGDSTSFVDLTTGMRAAGLATSWHFNQLDTRAALCQAINNCCSMVISRLVGSSLKRESLEPITFEVSWFVIELLARAGFKPSSDMFDSSVNLLIFYLLSFGLQDTMKIVLDADHELGGVVELPDCTAELWIRLIHVTDAYNQDEQIKTDHGHLFWKYVSLAIHDLQETAQPVEFSETIWRTVISLCTLSRFSVHGMASSNCQLPSNWKIIHLAIISVNLLEDAVVDKGLPQSILQKRDDYVGVVISRLPVLVRDNKWSFTGASLVMNHLAKVFTSRKCANLRHESGGFPSFIVSNDWSVLQQYDKHDTSFVIFLKLLVQMNDSPAGRLSPPVKKLLSLAIPVSALPADLQDASVLYNRYTAAAIGLFLEPTNMKYRLSLATKFLDIHGANPKIRLICIRALMYFGILLITLKLSLNEWYKWLHDILIILVTDHDRLSSTHQPENAALGEVVRCLILLLFAIQEVMAHYHRQSIYPDPAIFETLVTVAKGSLLSERDKVSNQFLLALSAFLKARANVMPPPQRPPYVQWESQEDSQEEFGMPAFDFTDPMVLAALDFESEESDRVRVHQVQDKMASEVFHAHVINHLYRHMCRAFLKYDGAATSIIVKERTRLWIHCWIGCADVIIRHRQDSVTNWPNYLKRRDDSWGRIRSLTLRRWADMQVMYELLRVDPMEYPALRERYMDILFESFSRPIANEDAAFLSLVFSIDGLRHELLRNIATIDAFAGIEGYKFPVETIIEARLSIFNSIIDCLDQIITRGPSDGVDDNVQRYIGSLITMYKIMVAELEVSNFPSHCIVALNLA